MFFKTNWFKLSNFLINIQLANKNSNIPNLRYIVQVECPLIVCKSIAKIDERFMYKCKERYWKVLGLMHEFHTAGESQDNVQRASSKILPPAESTDTMDDMATIF